MAFGRNFVVKQLERGGLSNRNVRWQHGSSFPIIDVSKVENNVINNASNNLGSGSSSNNNNNMMSMDQFALFTSTLSSFRTDIQLSDSLKQDLVGAIQIAVSNFAEACKGRKSVPVLEKSNNNNSLRGNLSNSWGTFVETNEPVIIENGVLLKGKGDLPLPGFGMGRGGREKEGMGMEMEMVSSNFEFVNRQRPVRLLPELYGGKSSDFRKERPREEVSALREDKRKEEEEVEKAKGEERRISLGLIKQRHAEFYRRLETQRTREMDAHQNAADEYKNFLLEGNRKGLGPTLPLGKALILSWFDPLTKAIKAQQDAIKAGTLKKGVYKEHASYLLGLEPEVLAVLVSHCVVQMLLKEHASSKGAQGKDASHSKKTHFMPKSLNGYSGFVKMVSAATGVGRAVEMEVKVCNALKKIRLASRNRKKRKTSAAFADAEKIVAVVGEIQFCEGESVGESETPFFPMWMKKGEIPTKEEARTLFDRDKARAAQFAKDEESWSEETVIHVGTVLLELLLNNAAVPEHLLSKGKKGKDLPKKENDKPISVSGDEKTSDDGLSPKPKGWKPAFIHDHVYIQRNRRYGAICCTDEVKDLIDISAENFVAAFPYMPMIVKPRRWTSRSTGGYLLLQSPMMRTHGARDQKQALKKAGKSLNIVYEALDVLGQTPWRINKRVASVLMELWEEGGGIAGLTQRGRDEVKTFDKEEYAKLKAECPEDLRMMMKERRRKERTNSNRFSLEADMMLKLKVVQEFWDETRFYYPHNLDFRGRAYPMHAHFNHLGADPVRGMLEFADPKPLGSRGLRWLKIQLANVIGGGVDKYSLDDRVLYADDNVNNIFDSAEKPLEGKRWWMHAEDPFQCLATCIEIRDALVSGNPETFLSYLPVHQDGSCNGLQHYAALGRDLTGAQQVNMTPADRPQDVYTGISEIVNKIVENDALNSLDEVKALYGRSLMGNVNRKLVKQTVMTSVYGVTFIGAREQILNRIREKGFVDDEDLAFKLSCYAARVTLDALAQMFYSARNIMNWLAECARLIAAENKTVEWATPLGLPVVQPYRKQFSRQVKTTLQVINISANDESKKVSASRQKSAFPPNFVHSLDSSHMMKTALACKERGLYFAGVHDSFWTHAGDIDTMNEILRDQFVELYSQPILEDLLASFRRQHPTVIFPEVPARGQFDLKLVKDSIYFFN